MDLGATLCTRSKPRCDVCPLHASCVAHGQGNVTDYPGKKPRRELPVRSTTMLIIRNRNGDILLEKRPSAGIWGGLWGFPEIDSPDLAANYALDRFGCAPQLLEALPPLRHSFSHYHLDITPLQLRLDSEPEAIMEGGDHLWYNHSRPAAVGMAAPVTKLLKKLN